MNVASTFRMLAGGLTASLLIGAFGTSAAEARPTKPGGVPGLAGVATWHSVTTYDVAATWGSVAGATSYRAVIVKGSTTLASKNVTGLSWDPTITSGPGPVTLQVQAIVNHRKGTPSKVTVDLPDKVAPTGAFSTSKVDATKVGTITQTALNDDSGTAGITRTVDWGDGTSAVNWASGTTIDHAFAAIGRYVPTVILSDVAGNSVQYTLDAIVLGDVTAPTGSVAVSPSTAWTSFTHVVATPSALSDDVSPQGMIRVHVVWGDGTTSDSTGTAALDHVYAAAGAYDVATTITDESGNPTDLPSSSVTVSDDTVGPKLTLALPAKKHSVKAWKTLRGKATDAPGTGVKKVSLRAVEKRGTAWYGYRPASKTWVKAATKARAYRKGRAFSLTTDAQHRWAASLAGLRKGTLCYKVSATDRVGNVSATRAHKASLTKP